MARYVVRFGSMRQIGLFSAKGAARFPRGGEVVAQTPRGVELGLVLCEADDRTADNLRNPHRGHILREASSDDLLEWDRLRQEEATRYDRVRAILSESNLPMKLVDIEQILGGEILVIYYLSDDRVDFRNLVKTLAGEFRTRIEMRQIGVRDEAKLLGTYGDCGKPLCCNTHLHEMPPVSMKMAKLQKATLDPTKISGRCGRLKCCLRYEYDTYVELKKSLPPIGAEVSTEKFGVGRVIGHEIVAEQALIETTDRRRLLLHVSEILSVARPKKNGPPPGERAAEDRPQDAHPRSNGASDAAPSQQRSPRNGPPDVAPPVPQADAAADSRPDVPPDPAADAPNED
ncbi:MAG TPA: regulatory iron-sulfur-containing complex subunit RicT [Pirellulaceae bacterium]|jgi:cell fate regulator YaaT (PSP1 superfamily)|nr:regulatory iron-sulfur-containing complex subunit RicT [Pirellulaceae bacterium]